MNNLDILKKCEGFDWDEGNIDKNWVKHHVSHLEAEAVFFNIPIIIASDKKHSSKESRYFALGSSDNNRWLFIAFTVRKNLIRIISARDMTKKERGVYEKENSKL